MLQPKRLIRNPRIRRFCCEIFLLAARQSVQARSALAPQRRFEPVVLVPSCSPINNKRTGVYLSFCILVAGVGLTKLQDNLVFLLAARQSVQARSALAPQCRFEPVVLVPSCSPINNKRTGIYLSFCILVAGVGLEPHDLQVMSLTSYQLLYPAMFDGAKVNKYFESPKFGRKKNIPYL